MPRATRPPRVVLPGEHIHALAVAALSLLTATTMALIFADGNTPALADTNVWAAVAYYWPEPDPSALVVDWFGNPDALLVETGLLVTVCLLVGRGRVAIIAGVAPWVVAAVTTGVKPLIDRTIHEPDNLAFPSGHTAVATAVALAAGLLVADLLGPRRRGGRTIVALALGFAGGGIMATAQVALDAHYPSDCLGGFLTAVAVLFPLAVLVDRMASSTTVRRLTTPKQAPGRSTTEEGSRVPGSANEPDDTR